MSDKIDFEKYINEVVLRTTSLNIETSSDFEEFVKKNLMFDNAILGISGEAGEIADIYKKKKYHVEVEIFEDLMALSNNLTKEDILNEIGDLMYYIGLALYSSDITMNEVLEFNKNKLKERYPDGFSIKKFEEKEKSKKKS